MLERIKHAVTRRVRPGTYRGPLAALIPVDAALSLLAKRSFAAYRLWDGYAHLTDPLFAHDRAPTDGEFDARRLAELQNQGYLSTPGPYPADAITATREWVLAEGTRARAEAERRDPGGSGDVSWQDDLGVFREVLRADGRFRMHFTLESLDAPSVPSVVRDFARAPEVRALARSYFGTGTIVDNLPYYMAEVMEPAPRLESWHIDCMRPTVKTYLMLDDVGGEQAPLRFIPGSHRVDAAKHRQFFAIAHGGLGSAYFEPEECERFDRAATSMTCPAGTMLVFDNRGIHAGSLCKSGRRILLAMGYRPVGATRVNPRLFRDPEPMKYPWDRRAGVRDTRFPAV